MEIAEEAADMEMFNPFNIPTHTAATTISQLIYSGVLNQHNSTRTPTYDNFCSDYNNVIEKLKTESKEPNSGIAVSKAFDWPKGEKCFFLVRSNNSNLVERNKIKEVASGLKYFNVINWFPCGFECKDNDYLRVHDTKGAVAGWLLGPDGLVGPDNHQLRGKFNAAFDRCIESNDCYKFDKTCLTLYIIPWEQFTGENMPEKKTDKENSTLTGKKKLIQCSMEVIHNALGSNQYKNCDEVTIVGNIDKVLQINFSVADVGPWSGGAGYYTGTVTEIYMNHAPEKLKDQNFISNTLKEHAGKEELLLTELKKTYNIAPIWNDELNRYGKIITEPAYSKRRQARKRTDVMLNGIARLERELFCFGIKQNSGDNKTTTMQQRLNILNQSIATLGNVLNRIKEDIKQVITDYNLEGDKAMRDRLGVILSRHEGRIRQRRFDKDKLNKKWLEQLDAESESESESDPSQSMMALFEAGVWEEQVSQVSQDAATEDELAREETSRIQLPSNRRMWQRKGSSPVTTSTSDAWASHNPHLGGATRYVKTPKRKTKKKRKAKRKRRNRTLKKRPKINKKRRSIKSKLRIKKRTLKKRRR